MTFAALLPLVLKYGIPVVEAVIKYGPEVGVLVAHLKSNIDAGKGDAELTPADWAEIARLGGLDSAEIYAKLGIALPPPATPGA